MKKRIATVSLAGCFGCHMSLLDIDERLLELLELVEFDRSPFNDLKRSTALHQLTCMRRLELLTDDEFTQFGQETRETVQRWLEL